MKDRWKILIAAGIVLALLAVSMLVTMRIQPENKVEAYKKFLREKGEKLDLHEVLPPAVPPESNSVSAVEAAIRVLAPTDIKIPEQMKMVAPGRAMIGCRQPLARGYDFTNSWDDFAVEIAADRPAIEWLHQVLERPRLDFQLDYKQGAKLLLPHLAQMKRATQRLDAAAIFDLQHGDTAAATTNILTILALAQRNTSEGLLISHLVRVAMTAIAVAPTWELLQVTNVTDAQLAAVQQGWEQMGFLNDAENAFTTERVWMTQEIQKYRASHEAFKKVTGSGSPGGSASAGWSWPPDWEEISEGPRNAIGEFMWRSSWSYAEELKTLQGEQIILETLRTMRTNRSQFYKADYDAMTSRLTSLGITNVGAAFFHALKIPDFSDTFGSDYLPVVPLKTLRIETARRVIVTAIALKRFQLKYGKWPEMLFELVPEFIPSVPIDPFDGKRLRYHPNADGAYLLYCVGEDGVDDGGDPSLPASVTSTTYYWQNTKARDWVWPQPATEMEIQTYYEEQARKSK
jgi:hypothetical protein